MSESFDPTPAFQPPQGYDPSRGEGGTILGGDTPQPGEVQRPEAVGRGTVERLDWQVSSAGNRLRSVGAEALRDGKVIATALIRTLNGQAEAESAPVPERKKVG